MFTSNKTQGIQAANRAEYAGAGIGPSVDEQMAKHNAMTAAVVSDRPRTASHEVMGEMDVLINRLMTVSDRAEGLADRLMGAYPSGEKNEQKPYPDGLLGEIARRIDVLKLVTCALETHVDRLQRLG